MATPTYEPIASYTFPSAAAFYTFTSIPQTYTDLVLVANVRLSSSLGELKLQYNGDTGSNYSRTRLYGADTNEVRSDTVPNDDSIVAGITSTGYSNTIVAQIQNYSSTAMYKTSLGRSGVLDYGAYVFGYTSLWRNTNAITSIKVLNNAASNFVAGSTLTLYGIANAAIGAPKAQGGIITYDNTYYYHTFGASGTFTPQQSLTADILVVAGGGGGGARRGGGGGAGGLLAFSSQSLTATGYTVTVGAGGAGGSGSGGSASNGALGGDSQFGALTLVKGGGGATGDGEGTVSTINGGSGGGSTGAYSGGTATSGQGNTGGAGSGSAPNYGAGGGGGKNAVGTAGTGTVGGNGGAGTSTYSYYGLVTGTGQNVSGTVYYAGGGAGAVYDGGTGGTGGLGGGGNAGAGGGNNAGIAGLTNTGGGGGGSSILSSGTAAAGAGGSGVVIIRYLKA